MAGSKADVVLESGDVVTLNLELNNVSKDDTVDFTITEAATAVTTLNVKSVGSTTSTLAILEADEAATVTFDASGGDITITDFKEAAAVTKLTTSGAGNVTLNDLSDAAALVTVTHSGTGTASFDIGTALATTVTSVTGSSSGAIKVTSGANTTAITGGSGNDEIDVAAIVYSGLAKVKGGAGTDILSISESTATIFTTSTVGNYSGFETLKVKGTGTDTYDFEALTGTTFTGLIVDTGTAATINKISTAVAEGGVDVTGVQSTSLTMAVKGATDPGSVNTLKLNLDHTTAATAVTVDDFKALGVETLVINSTGGHATTTSSLDLVGANDRLSNITLTGDGVFTLTDEASIGTEVLIDATARTGTTTITMDENASGMTIKGSSTGTNTITGGAGVDIITGGTGADNISTALGLGTIDFASGSDTLTTTTAQAEEANYVTVKNFDTLTDSIDGNGTAFSALGAGGNDTIVGGAAANEFSTKTTAGSFTVADPVAVLELSWEFSSGVDLDSGAAGSLSGTNLLAAMGGLTGTTAGTITTAGNDEDLLIIAYQDGDAFLYHGDGGGTNTGLVAAEISLIAMFEGVAVGDFTYEDFI